MESSKVVGSYYQNCSIYAAQCFPAMSPLDSVTHIFYAFASIEGANEGAPGAVKLSDPWADCQKELESGGAGCLGEFNVLKRKYPHLRLSLSIGGYGNSHNFKLLADRKASQNFVHSTSDFVDQFDLDGIDLDWEFPESPAERSSYVAIVREVRNALGSAKDSSIAAPAGEHNLQFIDLAGMDQYSSFWNVMTYDFAGQWSEKADHHAASYAKNGYSVARVIENYARSVHPQKLVMGIPLYGRSFAHTKGIGHSFSGDLPGSVQQGVHDVKDLPLKGFKEKVDSKAGATICTDGRNLVSYDNAATIKQKADFANHHSLRGAMFWQASNDIPNGGSSVRVFASEFLG